MTFADYLEAKKEVLRMMSSIRYDFTYEVITRDTYKERAGELLKKSHELDIAYGKSIDFFFAE